MILPALTFDEVTASEEPGFDMEAAENEQEAVPVEDVSQNEYYEEEPIQNDSNYTEDYTASTGSADSGELIVEEEPAAVPAADTTNVYDNTVPAEEAGFAPEGNGEVVDFSDTEEAETVLTYEDAEVRLTASFEDPTYEIPAGLTLKVAPIAYGSEQYNALNDGANERLTEIGNYVISYSAYYDIWFELNGETVIPTLNVKLEAQYKNRDLGETGVKLFSYNYDGNAITLHDDVTWGVYDDSDPTWPWRSSFSFGTHGGDVNGHTIVGLMNTEVIEKEETADDETDITDEETAAPEENAEPETAIEETAAEETVSEETQPAEEAVIGSEEFLEEGDFEVADEDIVPVEETEEDELTEAEAVGDAAADDEVAEDEATADESSDEADSEEASLYKVGQTVVDGPDYTVEVNIPEEAHIPADAELKVDEIDPESEAYKEYYDQAMAAINEEGRELDAGFARFFDIRFELDGVEIEPNPDTRIDVKINFEQTVEQQNEAENAQTGEVSAVHFAEDEVQEIKVETEAQGEAADVAEITFEASSFSVFGFVYTVDFEYITEDGSKIVWKWPGQGSYAIEDIMKEIGVEGEISNVSLVRTVDAGGSEKVLYLSEDKTELISEEAFEDTFELLVAVDGKTYVLVVTDDSMDKGVTVETYFLLNGHTQDAEAKSGETLNARVALSDSNPNPTQGNYTYVKVSIEKDPEVILDGYWEDGVRSHISIPSGTGAPTQIYFTYHENDGNPYIIYELPAGATGVAPLNFKTPNGTTPDNPDPLNDTKVKITAEFVDNSGTPIQGAANDSVSDPAVGKWTSEFKWDPIDKSVNAEEEHLSASNTLNDWLKYTFTANTGNKASTGAMWTDTITLTDTIELPEGMTFKATGAGTVEVTDTAFNFNIGGEHVFGLAGLGNLSVVGTPYFNINDNRHLTYTLTIQNPNRNGNIITAEMDSFNYQAEFNLGALNMTPAFITSTGQPPYPEISNTVNVTETSKDGRTDTSEDSVTTTIKANEGYELHKTSDHDGGTVESGNTIQYTVNLTNTGNAAFPDDGQQNMVDQLPDSIMMTPAQVEAVQIKVYDTTNEPPTEKELTAAELAAYRAKLTYDSSSNQLKFDATGLGSKLKIEFVYNATVKDAEALQNTAEGTTISNHVNYKKSHSYTSTTLKKPHYKVEKALSGTKGSTSDPVKDGEKAVYKLTATANQGAVSNVVMTDTLPPYMKLKVYDRVTHQELTDFYTDGNKYVNQYNEVCVSDGAGNFYNVLAHPDWSGYGYIRIEAGALDANQSTDYYYEVVFDADSAGNNVDENGYVKYSNVVTTPNGDRDEEEFVGSYGKLGVEKVHNPKAVDKDGNEITSPYKDGTVVTYYVTVNNDAKNPYTQNITVHDELPPGLFPLVTFTGSSNPATKTELLTYVTGNDLHDVTLVGGGAAKIKRSNNGYEIQWVIQNPQTTNSTDYITSVTLSYQAQIDIVNGVLDAGGNGELQNTAWVPGSRVVDITEVKEAGIEMNKVAISSEPNLSVEERLVKIQPGSSVTYQLTLTNPTNRDIVATGVKDTFPAWNSLGTLAQSNNYWSSSNVSYDKTSADCFDMHFAYPNNSGSTVGNNAITWRPILVKAGETLKTNVTLTFPSDVSLATAMFEQTGYETHNWFHVDGLEDKNVDHEISEDRKFDLQKSVVGFTKIDPHNSGSNSFNETTRDIFRKGAINEIDYAVAFANTGATPIHLINFQDDLPDCLELIAVCGNGDNWNQPYYGVNASGDGGTNKTSTNLTNEFEFDSNVLDQSWGNSISSSFPISADYTEGTITFTLNDGHGIDVPPRKYVVFHLRCKIKEGQETLTGIDAITNSIRATMSGDAEVKQTKLNEKRGPGGTTVQNNGDCTIVDKSNDTTTAQSSVTVHPLDVFVPGIKKQATNYKEYHKGTGYDAEWTAITPDHEQNFNSQGVAEWTINLYNDGTVPLEGGYTLTDYIPEGHHLTKTSHDDPSEPAFVTSYIIYNSDGTVKQNIPLTDSAITGATVTDTTATFTFGADDKYVIPAGGHAEMKIVTDFIASNQYQGQIKNNATLTPKNEDWNANLVTKGQLVKNEEGDKYTGVTSSDYINAYGDYATVSYKKIEAVDDADNSAYGYDDKNYIVVPEGTNRVKYTLQVSNLSGNALTDFVIIDRMPEIGDNGVINQSGSAEGRGSEFAVGMVAAGLTVSVKEAGTYGTVHPLTAASGAYLLQYSSKTAFTSEDFNGTSTEGWHDQLQEGDKSFRIVLKKENTGLKDTSNREIVVPGAGGKAIVEYYGTIDSAAIPGQTAYNSFGYWFKNTNEDSSDAEPPKVGVMIERQPSIQKQVLDEDDQVLPADPSKEFVFNFYDVTDVTAADFDGRAITVDDIKGKTPEELEAKHVVPLSINPLTLAQGASANLEKQQTINGTTKGAFIDGHTYLVIEEPADGYYSDGYTVDGLKKSTSELLSFTYNSADKVTVVALNKEDESGWQPEATKTLITKAGTPLEDQQFTFNLYKITDHGTPDEAVSAEPEGTAKNDGTGMVTFDRIQYSAADTYWYRMQEVVGTDKNIIYDETIYDVKVEVTETNGRFKATPTYYKKGTGGDTQLAENVLPSFVNKEATQISVQKVWNGNITGSTTMVLYQAIGDKEHPENDPVPSDKFVVNVVGNLKDSIDPTKPGTPKGTANIIATFTAEGEEDVVVTLNNSNSWAGTARLTRGKSYSATYATNDSAIITNIVPFEPVTDITDPTTLNVTADAVAATQYDVVFNFTNIDTQSGAVDIAFTHNGNERLITLDKDHTSETVKVTEEDSYSYSITQANGFISAITAPSVLENSVSSVSQGEIVNIEADFAPTTMNVPVGITWTPSNPDAGTSVTVRLTPSDGGSVEIVTLNGRENNPWNTSKTLNRFDEDGNLLTWTVSVDEPTIPEGCAEATITNSPDSISGSGSVALTGEVERAMTIAVYWDGNGGYAQIEGLVIPSADWNSAAKDESSYYDGSINCNTKGIVHTFSNLRTKDDDNQAITYGMWFQNGPWRITTDIPGATYRQWWNDAVIIPAKGGSYTIYFEKDSDLTQNEVNYSENVGDSISANTTDNGKKFSMGVKSNPKILLRSTPNATLGNINSSTTYADSSVGGVGTAFTAIRAKDLPSGATPVAALPKGTDGNAQTSTKIIEGNGTHTWTNLPTTDASGNPIYYYVVEKDATADADEISVNYSYEYYDNDPTKGIKKVTVTNTPVKKKGSISVSKTWDGVTDATDLVALQAGFSITINGVDAGGSGIDTKTLTWADVKDAPYKIDNLPLGETYSITEANSATSTLQKYELVSASSTTSFDNATPSSGGTEYALVNTYKLKPGSLKLKKIVELNGEDNGTSTLTDDTYTFNIVKSDDSSNTHTVMIKYVGGKITEAKVDGNTATADSDGFYEVSNLPVGDYVITEASVSNGTVIKSITGGKNDGNISTRSITVTVEAGKDGTKVEAAGKATFTNNKLFTKKKPTVTKMLNGAAFTGKDSANQDTSFTFTLKKVTKGGTNETPVYTVGDTLQTKTSASDGSVTFDEIEYTAAGTYYYEITETGEDSETMDYADPVYVKIVVSGTDTLSAADPVYYSDSNFITAISGATSATFNNIELGELDLSKMVSAGTGSTLPEGYKDQQFTFTITLGGETTLPATVPVTIVNKTNPETIITAETNYSITDKKITVILKDGQKAVIKKIPVGTTYDIAETAVAGYTLSWHDTNGNSGTISKTASTAEATNTFNSTSYTPLVDKKLNGIDFDGKLGDGTTTATFTFDLKEMTVDTTKTPAEYTVSGTALQSKSTGNDGKVTFEPIKYNKAGTYYYQITEQGTDSDTMDYDNDPIYLKVVVSADLKTVTGTYHTDQACESTASDKATFENTELTEIDAEKEWANVTLNDGDEATFTLYADDISVSGKNITVNGKVDVAENAESGQENKPDAINANAYEDTEWHGKWTNLPKYKVKGSEAVKIAYTVEETSFKFNSVEYIVEKQNDNSYKVKKGSAYTTTWTVTKDNNTFTNTQTSVDVTKIWKNETSDIVSWPDVAQIEFELVRFKNGETEKDTSLSTSTDGIVTITLKKPENADASPKVEISPDITGVTVTASKVTVNVNDDVGYEVKLYGLEKSYIESDTEKEYSYQFTENSLAGYRASYGSADGTINTNSKYAAAGGGIINTPFNAVELPSTGGRGTLPFKVSGSILLAFSALMYVTSFRRRQQKALARSGGYFEGDAEREAMRGGGSRR